MRRNFMKMLGLTATLALAGLAGATTGPAGPLTDSEIAAKAAHEIRMYSRYTIWDNINLRVRDGNDRDVRGVGALAQRANRGDHPAVLRTNIHDDEHGFFPPGLLQQARTVAQGLHAIAQVLQAIHQLSARQQLFIGNERQRFRHGTILK